MESEEIIAWTRAIVLFGALSIAAWLDHKDRRVPNEFWITWSKPAIFLWTLDLLNQEAEWYIFASAAAVVAQNPAAYQPVMAVADDNIDLTIASLSGGAVTSGKLRIWAVLMDCTEMGDTSANEVARDNA